MSSEWLRKRFAKAAGRGDPPQEDPQQQPSPAPYRRPKFLRGGGGGGGAAPGGRERRPVCALSRERPLLQWSTGYAETINAEKSEFNEDQATCCQISIRKREYGKEEDQEWLILCSTEYLTGYYWALFDGHGGPEASIMASNYLHYCIKQKLEDVVEGITEVSPPMHLNGQCVCQSDPQFVEEKQIHQEDVVIAALENAFQECDEVIGQEMEITNQSGGCTALAVLYLQGKLYVANAGDSRALLVRKETFVPLSTEFTPETERQRIQHLAFIYPKLLADEFTRYEFPRRLKGDDVGQKVLYRDYSMEGWGYKTVVKDDLKYPLIHGHGKQVEVFDFTKQHIKEDDVLIMATDGLWDVMSNEDVAQIVRNFLQNNTTDPYRFSELAKCLVQKARGKKDGYYWTMDSNMPASYDDISVFAIPLYNKDEH
ncbi:protein phosphatase 1M isoform X2 [Sceloporus undulatus]|uniref:protein phosphatase 1M isoform X2 n=1 Tax=Sceloporus undulatus TaxID=8520 RepID=UPI001C4B28E5|nr:protein phosphatase 1M isoform X2 [Sceloporus undulatus]